MFGIITMSTVGTALWLAVMTPQMDGLILRIIRAFKPSFVPYKRPFEITPRQTRRQAVEWIAYRTLVIIVHLFLLRPLLFISLLLVTKGTLWMTGLNAPKYALYLEWFSKSLVATDLLLYYDEMAKGALMLDETRQIELANLTNQIRRDSEGRR